MRESRVTYIIPLAREVYELIKACHKGKDFGKHKKVNFRYVSK